MLARAFIAFRYPPVTVRYHLSTYTMPRAKRSAASAAAASPPPKYPSDVESDASDAPKPKAKKAKKAKEPVKPLDASLPTNKELPDELTPIAKRPDGQVRISAWNVCGIKSCDKKVSGT